MIKYRLKESDDDEKPEPETTGGGGSNKEKIDYDIFLTPKGKSLDDVIKALKDIENYGTYVSNMRSKASVEDAIVKHFGPTVPVKKKQLEKEMGKPFPMKTKQAIDDLVKSLTSRPTLLSYHKEGDELVFPKNSNPSKDLTKKIIKVVLGNAGIGYSLKDKENLGEIDINDPILMQMRSKPKYNPLKMGNDKEKISYEKSMKSWEQKMDVLKKAKAKILKNDPNIELEGGPIADEYGKRLNKIDMALSKLQKTKDDTEEYTYQQIQDKIKDTFKETKLINILKTAINESMYATLGGEHPYTDAEMRRNIVEPNLGSNYDAYIMFINDEYKFLKDDLVTDFNFPTGWKKLYRSSSDQGEAYLSPQGNVIKASILSGGGIVGAIYVTKDMNEDYNSKWKSYINEYEGEGEDASIDDENLGYYSEKDEEGPTWYDIADELQEYLIDCGLFEDGDENRVAAIASDLKETERISNGGRIPDHIFKKIKDLGNELDSKERGVN